MRFRGGPFRPPKPFKHQKRQRELTSYRTERTGSEQDCPQGSQDTLHTSSVSSMTSETSQCNQVVADDGAARKDSTEATALTDEKGHCDSADGNKRPTGDGTVEEMVRTNTAPSDLSLPRRTKAVERKDADEGVVDSLRCKTPPASADKQPTQSSSAVSSGDSDVDDGAMGPRSKTYASGDGFARRLDTYSAEDEPSFVPQGYRKSILSRTLSPDQAAIFATPFEQWKTVDRSTLAGWRPACRGIHPRDLENLGAENFGGKIRIFHGPVTAVETDAIVNAANEGCLGGGGVDGAIHDMAGPLLVRECATFPGCATGQTRITKGYNLPARFILHTVGPVGERPKALASCYRTCFELAHRHSLRSVAFCCISAGIFGYPLRASAQVAIRTALSLLSSPLGEALRLRCFCMLFIQRVSRIQRDVSACGCNQVLRA